MVIVQGGDQTYARACTSEDIHKALHIYNKAFDKWVDQRNKKQWPILKSLLIRFTYTDISDCNRFLLKLWHSLSRANSDFYNAYDNYWDACGKVVGILLEDQNGKHFERIDTESILNHWTQRFREADWHVRPKCIKAFINVARLYTNWDEHFWKLPKHCEACCEAYTSLPCDLPKTICNTISWLLDFWREVAERYANELEKGHRSKYQLRDVLDEIVGAVLPILGFIYKAWDSPFFQTENAVSDFRAIIFRYTFPVEELVGKGKVKTVSRTTKKKLKEFRLVLTKMIDQEEGLDKVGFLKNILETFDTVQQQISWWFW
jgi:hypothetical protein